MIINTQKINSFLGVAGVNPSERLKARQIGRIFEFLVLLALLVVFARLLIFYNDGVVKTDWITHAIWLVFFLELVFNLFNVEKKIRYLKENWLNVLIVLIAFPAVEWGNDWIVAVRSLRLVLFLRFFNGFFKDIIIVLGRNRFGQILSIFAFIIIGSGAIFAYLEDRQVWDGVWYALVTITTVGYGDVVPVSDEGRVFGVILILFGVVFFSLVTANISAFLIGSEQRKVESDILSYMKLTEKRLAEQQALNEDQVERIVLHMSTEIAMLREEINEMHIKTASQIKNTQDEEDLTK
ncbi:potassium channel family protein [Thiomicrorhabdus sp. Milos-T2]|uniref:potassium channel family protein n=1 Tax=Thiomicrorhabdus sp. Milos-T2 TaxID=90814 RepID=UPI0009FCD5E7|nr:potassium channel family protein [Thiomicrorhabdus sp. Milos-T2]